MIVYTLHEAHNYEGSTFIGAFSSFDGAVEYLVESLCSLETTDHEQNDNDIIIFCPDQFIICKSEVDGTAMKKVADDKHLFSISREQLYNLFASEKRNHKGKPLFNLKKDVKIISPVIKHIMAKINPQYHSRNV